MFGSGQARVWLVKKNWDYQQIIFTFIQIALINEIVFLFLNYIVFSQVIAS